MRVMVNMEGSRVGVKLELVSLDFVMRERISVVEFFFFNDTATTEIYTLSLHDAFRSKVNYKSDLSEPSSLAFPS